MANVSDAFMGVPYSHQGIMAGQYERTDELNQRIGERQFPDMALQPNFDPRPTPTKYSRFPIIERRAPTTVPILAGKSHCVRTNFNPGTARAPVGTYLANIDTDTVLSNRHRALQRYADQGVYVPNSDSDLYHVAAIGRQEQQTHPGLFVRHDYTTSSNPVASQIGQDMFHNNTRTQLRALSHK